MTDVSRINHLENIPEKRQKLQRFNKRKQKKRPRHHFVKRNIQALTKIADEAHEELQAMNSPFRLCVYQEGDEVFIDVVAMDKSGNTIQVFRHDITNDEFEDLIHQLKTGRGLMFSIDA
ncbi:MAG: hypothetical protein GY710_02245 [Desulfobacteraceae bacterium]|nr:hypothetical protein [Desulfobacteraceae bacterium]